jgi:hypothetical protein
MCAKIKHSLGLHSPQNGAVCNDIDSHAQYFYPIFKDKSGGAAGASLASLRLA